MRICAHTCVFLTVIGCLLTTSAAADETLRERGANVYAESCAECHGSSGQGVEGAYDDPLIGDATIGELTELISATMPEGDPEACVGEDAAAVASYIHHAFYSEAARIRNRPPRAELARLTAEQLRQSLADLYGRFEGMPWLEQRRGLEAKYFDGSRWKKENLKVERIDPVIDFDFGRQSPAEGVKAEEFFIQWEGSLKVDHSGRYEIVLRSSCSCQMYFGARDRMLIDNHVQSEGKTEFRRTLQLTGGRLYPLRIEFVQRERKTEQPPASVSLSWVPPHGEEQIIPTRFLIPATMPGQFALQSKLPPDDQSYGYERGIAINRQWDESTTAAAIEFAEIAADELWPLYRRRNRDESDDDRSRLKQFLGELVETALRGKLDEESRKLYIDNQLAEEEDDAEAIKRVVLITLKSPRFLYPTLDYSPSESRRIANRLSLIVHDSLPSDQWLLKQIEENQLQSESQIREAARKMVSDPRALHKMRALVEHWFDLSDIDDIDKDPEEFEGFDVALTTELRGSFDAFVDEILSSEQSDFRQLLLADWTFTTEKLADFYGDSWQPAEDGDTYFKRSVSAPERAGILTHPLVTSSFAHHDATSPIHRGVLLYRHVLGRTLRPPNAAFMLLDAELHPDLTTRQRVELQTADTNCQVCHRKINPLGFALENFDAAGRYRTEESGKKIDPSGEYVDRQGNRVQFSNARELAEYLADSDDSRRAFVESAFEFFVKQPIAAFGADTADQLARDFAESDYNIRELIVNIAVIAAQEPTRLEKT